MKPYVCVKNGPYGLGTIDKTQRFHLIGHLLLVCSIKDTYVRGLIDNTVVEMNIQHLKNNYVELKNGLTELERIVYGIPDEAVS